MAATLDVEKDMDSSELGIATSDKPNNTGSDDDEKRHEAETEVLERQSSLSSANSLLHKALRLGRVEENGIQPIPLEGRNSTRFYNIFTVWFSMNATILAITFGLLGPTVYNLGLRDCSLIIIFFSFLATIAPAYLGTMGPKTGMRQMIQARFSFGRYPVSVVVLLNVATLTGFLVVMCVIGGQCLSAVSDGNLTPTAGIIIISLLSLLISFCGFRVLHVYEMWASIPAVIALCIAVGCGGDGLKKQVPPSSEGPTAQDVMSFGMIVASYTIPWSCIASDFTTYFNPKVPAWRVFAYSYAGLYVPTVLIMILGAAMAGALSSNPTWNDGYNLTGAGGILAAMLSPAGGFGKFIVVILALSLLGNCSGTMYAITLNLQTLIPWLVRVPRYLFAIVVTAVVIPVSIRAAFDFFNNLNNFVAIIGYWSAAFVGIVVVELHVFRHNRVDAFDHAIWSDARKLPWGAAALTSGVLCFALVIPSMAQVWWTGPIAQKTGDIGFEMALVLSAILYVPLRTLERKVSGR